MRPILQGSVHSFCRVPERRNERVGSTVFSVRPFSAMHENINYWSTFARWRKFLQLAWWALQCVIVEGISFEGHNLEF